MAHFKGLNWTYSFLVFPQHSVAIWAEFVYCPELTLLHIYNSRLSHALINTKSFFGPSLIIYIFCLLFLASNMPSYSTLCGLISLAFCHKCCLKSIYSLLKKKLLMYRKSLVAWLLTVCSIHLFSPVRVWQYLNYVSCLYMLPLLSVSVRSCTRINCISRQCFTERRKEKFWKLSVCPSNYISVGRADKKEDWGLFRGSCDTRLKPHSP